MVSKRNVGICCPNCGYESTYRDDENHYHLNPEGEFFEPSGNSQQLSRTLPDRTIDIVTLFGCPKCKQVFIY